MWNSQICRALPTFILSSWIFKDFKLPSVLRSGPNFKKGTQKGATPSGMVLQITYWSDPYNLKQPTFHKRCIFCFEKPLLKGFITDAREASAASITLLELGLNAFCRKCLEETLCAFEASLKEPTPRIPHSRIEWLCPQTEWSTWASPSCCPSLRTIRRGWKGAASLSWHTEDGRWLSYETLNSTNTEKRSVVRMCGAQPVQNTPTSK